MDFFSGDYILGIMDFLHALQPLTCISVGLGCQAASSWALPHYSAVITGLAAKTLDKIWSAQKLSRAGKVRLVQAVPDVDTEGGA